jgi:lysophospholipase L1-like esterase
MSFRASFLLLVILLISYFVYHSLLNAHSNLQITEVPMKFLALGDSYTIGESVLVEERWPVQLATFLRSRGMPIDDPEIIAKTGWTTDELLEGIIRVAPHPPYALVSLLIGVNNQYRGGSQETYREEFVELLQQAIDFAGGDANRVIVLSIPDWGVTPFGARDVRGRTPELISAEIASFNAINREETTGAGAHYIDITPISQRAATDLTLLAADELHPSGKMYELWVEETLPAVIQIIDIP